METRVRSPLFDRLVDLEPRVSAEPRPLRALHLRGLRESVHRELERLLNTRSSLPVDRLAERAELTVLEYGIPDLSAYSAGSAEDQGLLAGVIVRAVTAFEPRLRGVKVAVLGLKEDQRCLRLRIDAVLTADEVAEPVSFPMVVGVKSGTVEVQPLAD
ncbi:MAG TPA: type VI secretion system baseplate subunit TssE [Thermoanaerobaculia bacterium]|nr:type VI secretion system baseplate subunit TssE [Thermoanaerobaculia bacterium]